MLKRYLKIKVGFTLAEVLITLAIIGVVMSLTLSPVIQNYRNQRMVSALKKFYTEMNKAFRLSEMKNGPINEYGMSNAEDLFGYFKPFLNIIKECSGNDTSCFYDGQYKDKFSNITTRISSINSSSSVKRIVLADGQSVAFSPAASNSWSSCRVNAGSSKELSGVCGYLLVDLNGHDAPNRLAVDTFFFHITRYGIYPMGTAQDTGLDKRCTFNYCNSSSGAGEYAGCSCTAWAVFKGNMDYMSKTVSW